MFHSIRLQLTLWYVATIMIISGLFSMAIYQLVSMEIQRGFTQIEHRIIGGGIDISIIDPDQNTQYADEFNVAQGRVRERLIYANAVIFLLASMGGYFLSGKTLAPIEEAHEKQKQFIADASHELKTPLTAIHTSIEVALRDKKLNLNYAKTTLEESLEDIQNLEELTKNLISLSQIQTQEHHLITLPIDLDEIVRTVAKKLKPLINKKKLTLNLKLAPIIISADENKITEVITILLDNAIKYSPPKETITISLTQSRSKATITVSDHGIGISKNDLPHIFDRFYRSDSSRTKSRIPGFGLGLCLAKQIIEHHRGTIKVTSKLDSGSTFIITLPTNLS